MKQGELLKMGGNIKNWKNRVLYNHLEDNTT
jgi:hypothetical protein